MRLQNKNRFTTKKLVITIIIALLALAIIAFVFYLYQSKSNILGWYPFGRPETSSINYGPPTQQEIETGNQVKDETVEKETAPSVKTPTENEGNSPSTATNTVAVSITSAYQDGSVIKINSVIQKITTQGECTIAFKSTNGTVVTKKADIQALSSYSTCKGFAVPTSELSTGIWVITLTYVNGNESGSASTNLQVQS